MRIRRFYTNDAEKDTITFFFTQILLFNPGKQVVKITNISSRDIILDFLCCLVAVVFLFSWFSMLAGWVFSILKWKIRVQCVASVRCLGLASFFCIEILVNVCNKYVDPIGCFFETFIRPSVQSVSFFMWTKKNVCSVTVWQSVSSCLCCDFPDFSGSNFPSENVEYSKIQYVGVGSK